MTEQEAILLRERGAKLYHRTKIAFAALATIGKIDDIERDAVWKASGLEDSFHELNSCGYELLIREGWTPFKTAEAEQEEFIRRWDTRYATSD